MREGRSGREKKVMVVLLRGRKAESVKAEHGTNEL